MRHEMNCNCCVRALERAGMGRYVLCSPCAEQHVLHLRLHLRLHLHLCSH
jgi:hypothetical protein